MSELLKNNFDDDDIDYVTAEADAQGVAYIELNIRKSYEGQELILDKQELVDMLTLINQKEEQIKMNKWLADKVNK